MSDTWANESALEHALEVLAERYPSERIEIVETFDIAWVGWECDYQGALITRDGVPEIVIVDETGVGRSQPVAVTLRERLVEYGRLIVETERVLQRWMSLRAERADPAAVLKAIEAFGTESPQPGDEMPDDIADAIEREVVPPLHHVDLLRDFLWLTGADAALLKAKWELMRITALALDEHGIEIVQIAAEIGETPEQLQRWLDYVVREVPFERLAAVYHAVAERAQLWPLEWLIGGKPGGDE